MVRVAAKPWRPAKTSGCPTAAVAASATGSAPLRATSARIRRRRVWSAKAVRQRDLLCLRRGTFHRGKVPKTRRGLRPRTPFGSAAYIPRGGISQAVTIHRAIPSHTTCPFPASRGPGESDNRYGYRTFLKGRTNCPGTGGRCCTRQLLRTNITVHAVGAAISRPPSNVIGAPVANVPESNSTVGADAHIGPCRVSGLSQRAQRLWKATCIAAPLWPQ